MSLPVSALVLTLTLGQAPGHETKALEKLNAYRKAAGSDPLTLDPRLNAACDAHVKYAVRNVRGNDANLGPEDPNLPGYTKEGAEAARVNAKVGIERLDPAAVIDRWMAGFEDRGFFLSPGMKFFGFAAARHKTFGWIVMVKLTYDPIYDTPGLYPLPDQKDVPIAFPGGEAPDPLPPGARLPAGYPITVQFFKGAVKNVQARLVDGAGREVPAWVSTPEKPVHAKYQNNTICLMAQGNLQYATKYTVAITADVDGKPWERTWSFTTVGEPKKEKLRKKEEVEKLPDEKEILAQLNAYRKLAGLKPATLDSRLSKGCVLHAEYLVKNAKHPSTAGLGGHDERPDLPGYTKEGERAGQAGVIAICPDPRDAVDGWLATFYHRLPLIHPALNRIGFGCARGGLAGSVSVLDYGSGMKDDRVLIYPADKVENVPLEGNSRELTNLDPKITSKRCGYPITVDFAPGTKIKKTRATLTLNGKKVDAWISTPDAPLRPSDNQRFLLVAKDALRTASVYTVTIEAEVNSEPWRKKWSFTTKR
jgi:uncharacterized protein YkwD